MKKKKIINTNENVISISNISKIYHVADQEVRALDDVDLSIKRGEYVAIMGASGSGKSTLMNILGCLDRPTLGTYFLNGENVGLLKDDDLAEIRNKEIGFVFQSFNLMPRLTALENVELPLIYAAEKTNIRKDKAKKGLDSVGLLNRMSHLPNELSGGQKQRVAMARALINNPSIILADEPTGNLDTKTSYDMMNLFNFVYHEGNTVILVTHEEDIASYARRIIRLRDGKILSDRINENPKIV